MDCFNAFDGGFPNSVLAKLKSRDITKHSVSLNRVLPDVSEAGGAFYPGIWGFGVRYCNPWCLNSGTAILGKRKTRSKKTSVE